MNFIQTHWPAPSHIKAYTTLRTSWGERFSYHDHNQGHFDKNNPNCVDESRKLEALLALPNEPIWVTQTHSTIVLEASLENKEKIADGTYTHQANRVCVVTTADCLPILMTNKTGSIVAALHAGWRGLSAGIIENAIPLLNEAPRNLMAWLGPCIGPDHFEVGSDVYEAFIAKHKESAAAFNPHTPGKWLANLYELAKVRLRLMGVTQIYGGDYCTFKQADLFYSYRRNKGKTGRMASVIWISNP